MWSKHLFQLPTHPWYSFQMHHMFRLACLFVYTKLVLFQIWIQFVFPAYLEKFTIDGKKLPDEKKDIFVQNFFQMEPNDQIYSSSMYTKIVKFGINYLKHDDLKCFRDKLEATITAKLCKNVLHIILQLHYEACQKLQSRLPALELWNSRGTVEAKDRLKFVMTLFQLDNIANKSYRPVANDLMHQTVKYITLEAQTEHKMSGEFLALRAELINMLRLLYTCKTPKDSKLALVSVYRALLLDLTTENSVRAPNQHLKLSIKDNSASGTLLPKKNNGLSLVFELNNSKLHNQELSAAPLSSNSRLNEATRNITFNSDNNQSILANFEEGKGLSAKDMEKFVQCLFKIKSNYRNGRSRPYTALLRIGIDYIENRSLERLKYELEGMVGRQFCKGIIETILQLHYETCKELKLSSSTLNDWNKRRTIKEEQYSKFIRDLFQCKYINNRTCKSKIENLVQKAIDYIRLEAQDEGKMTLKFRILKQEFLDSLKSLYSFHITAKPRLAMFEVYQALLSSSTTNHSSQLSNFEPAQFSKCLSEQKPPIKSYQIEQARTKIPADAMQPVLPGARNNCEKSSNYNMDSLVMIAVSKLVQFRSKVGNIAPCPKKQIRWHNCSIAPTRNFKIRQS